MKMQKGARHLGKVVAREELYEAVWTKTLKALEQEWNTSHEQLLVACKKMNVPRPNQRYWPLISWGHRVGRKPLPRRNRKTPGEMLLPPRGRSRSALLVETSVTKEELRRQAEARELDKRRLLEEQRRKLLVESSEAWFEARRLRKFVRACEVVMRDGGEGRDIGWQDAWLAWAREQADFLDPMTSGFLEGERKRVVAKVEGRGPGLG